MLRVNFVLYKERFDYLRPSESVRMCTMMLFLDSPRNPYGPTLRHNCELFASTSFNISSFSREKLQTCCMLSGSLTARFSSAMEMTLAINAIRSLIVTSSDRHGMGSRVRGQVCAPHLFLHRKVRST